MAQNCESFSQILAVRGDLRIGKRSSAVLGNPQIAFMRQTGLQWAHLDGTFLLIRLAGDRFPAENQPEPPLASVTNR